MTARDPEILFELRSEPELLAVADGLAESLAAYRDAPARRRRPTRRAMLAASLATVAGGSAALVALLLADNGVQPRLVDRALAAVGDAPVLHAVLRQEDAPDMTLVELSTGRRIAEPRVTRTEIWFDKSRALEHTITHSTGRPVTDDLATRAGITSNTGPVWTCARIAAHPLEATKARVSCNFNGDNGTTPRHVPEAPPTLDPALAGFVDGYREALAGGAARKVGEGNVHGHHVFWLEFRLPDLSEPTGGPEPRRSEQVAVASDTYRPIVVRALVDGVAGQVYSVVEIETVSRDEADFSKPKLLPPGQRATGWKDAVVTNELTLDDASKELGTRALWAGPELDGLKLSLVQRREISTSFARGTGLPPRVTPVVALVYGQVHREHPANGSIEIIESSVPTGSWLLPEPATPRAGFVGLNQLGWGYVRVGELYVEIRPIPFGEGKDSLVVAAARRLTPVPPAH